MVEFRPIRPWKLLRMMLVPLVLLVVRPLAGAEQLSLTSTAVTIPDGGPAGTYPLSFNFSFGTPGSTVSDITISLNSITHTNLSNLDMMLVGPGANHRYLFMSDA